MGLGKVAPWYASGVDKDKEISVAANGDVNLGFPSIIPGTVKLTIDGVTYTDDASTGEITTNTGKLTVHYKSGVITSAIDSVVAGTITYNYDNINEPTKIPTLFAGRKNLRMIAKQYALSTPVSVTAAEIARRSPSTVPTR